MKSIKANNLMSQKLFAKNISYLRRKRKLTGEKLVKKVNVFIEKEFDSPHDKFINRKRLGAYEEGRAYFPAYLLPIFCKVLKVRNSLSLFRDDIENLEKTTVKQFSN